MQDRVRFLPSGHLLRDRIEQIFKLGEVLVMGTEPPREFPHALDRIQFRAIGRQVVQAQHVPVLAPEGF